MVATVDTNAQRILDKVLSAGALGDLERAVGMRVTKN